MAIHNKLVLFKEALNVSNFRLLRGDFLHMRPLEKNCKSKEKYL